VLANDGVLLFVLGNSDRGVEEIANRPYSRVALDSEEACFFLQTCDILQSPGINERHQSTNDAKHKHKHT
jgi:hypothetical protein